MWSKKVNVNWNMKFYKYLKFWSNGKGQLEAGNHGRVSYAILRSLDFTLETEKVLGR